MTEKMEIEEIAERIKLLEKKVYEFAPNQAIQVHIISQEAAKALLETCKRLTAICNKIPIACGQPERDKFAAAVVEAEDAIALAEKKE